MSVTDNAFVTNSLTKDQEILEKIMNSRRSHYPRHFTGEEISDELILKLIEYANMAPNHKKTHPWRFQVFKSDALNNLIEFKKAYFLSKNPNSEKLEKKLKSFEVKKTKTSHVLAIIMKRDDAKRVPVLEEHAAVSCAVQNIYLSLNPYGLGGYWSTGEISYSDEVRKYLDLNEDESMMGFFYLGVVNEQIPVGKRESVNGKVKWIK